MAAQYTVADDDVLIAAEGHGLEANGIVAGVDVAAFDDDVFAVVEIDTVIVVVTVIKEVYADKSHALTFDMVVHPKGAVTHLNPLHTRVFAAKEVEAERAVLHASPELFALDFEIL